MEKEEKTKKKSLVEDNRVQWVWVKSVAQQLQSHKLRFEFGRFREKGLRSRDLHPTFTIPRFNSEGLLSHFHRLIQLIEFTLTLESFNVCHTW